MKRRISSPLISTTLCLAVLSGCSTPETASGWAPAGTLVHARSDHAATLLSDGSVLVSGGVNGSSPVAAAEVLDTATNQWYLAKAMQEPRFDHVSVLLNDARVLLIGGTNGSALDSAEAFDHATNQFATVAAMKQARTRPAAVGLKSAKYISGGTMATDDVLVVGGENASGPLATVESYEPATNSWTDLPSMAIARTHHTATLFEPTWENDAGVQHASRMLVVGGLNASQQTEMHAEVYDFETGTWTSADASDSSVEARRDHTATLLDQEHILVVGGRNDTGVLASAEIYQCLRDELLGTVVCGWSPQKSALKHPRRGHTATKLNDGHVLIVGGEDANGPLDSVEMYDIETQTFVEVEPLSMARTEHTATWLADGTVLVAGGKDNEALATVERFFPADTRIPCQSTVQCPRAMVCNSQLFCEQSEGPLTTQACSYSRENATSNGTPICVVLAALLVVCRKRKRLSKRTAAVTIAGAMLFVPGLSQAQTPTFYLDRLQIAGGSEDGTGVWRPVFGRTGLFGQVAYGYARNPLRVATFARDAIQAQALDGSAVSLQMTAYASVGIELAQRGAIQVSLPYVVQQRGYATDERTVGLNQVVAMAPSALGDLRIDGRMLVVWNESRTLSLAVRGAMILPTGDEYSFTSEGHAWGNVGLSVEYNADVFFATANAGWVVRPKSALVNLTVGTEFVYAFGAYVPFQRDRVRLGAEIWGSIGLLSRSPEELPVEGALSGRMALGASRRVFLGLSAGGRLGIGYAPDMRFVARLGGVLPFEKEEREPTLPVRIAPEPDTDEDGVLDADDKCPAVREDAVGERDGCPETSATKVVNKQADKDPDHDGIDSSKDQCPLVAEDKDGLADEDGCPEDDFDGDGFADVEDKCPKDPGVRNNAPEKLGCPKFIEHTTTEVKLVRQVEFDLQSATIKPTSYPILDEIAKVLAANPDIKQLRIEGHTDNVGSAVFNQSLSARRAEAVKDYLVQRGKVNPARLSFQGFGPTKPIAPNNTDAGRAKNRRVELHIGTPQGDAEKKKP